MSTLPFVIFISGQNSALARVTAAPGAIETPAGSVRSSEDVALPVFVLVMRTPSRSSDASARRFVSTMNSAPSPEASAEQLITSATRRPRVIGSLTGAATSLTSTLSSALHSPEEERRRARSFSPSAGISRPPAELAATG